MAQALQLSAAYEAVRMKAMKKSAESCGVARSKGARLAVSAGMKLPHRQVLPGEGTRA
jgi:hypothetical protein